MGIDGFVGNCGSGRVDAVEMGCLVQEGLSRVSPRNVFEEDGISIYVCYELEARMGIWRGSRLHGRGHWISGFRQEFNGGRRECSGTMG